ncbi:MAG: TonB-dependent receptor [Rhodocyclales bacterium]|nr:TonB-dependent receptor [Rhodocyclales bacterium]
MKRCIASCNALVVLAATALPVLAQETRLGEVLVTATPEEQAATTRKGADLYGGRARSSDSAMLLDDIPGVSLYGAGGVSSLPAIHGLADDRLRIKVDGIETISSCPNHMNSPLSYIDPTAVGSVKVYAGLAPVSVGGDSIGGAVVVEAALPPFAAPGQGSLMQGEAGAFYRSNGNANGANLAATYATESLSLTYTGATTESANYKAGGNYQKFRMSGVAPAVPADVVGSTAYRSRNHTLGLALKGDKHLVEAKLGYQDIPYELYPNQRMDMLNNVAHRFSLRYLGQLDWGALEARAYRETVDHYMDFGKDKMYNYGALTPPTNTTGATYQVNGMPMYTQGITSGASVKADVALTPSDLLRVGAEMQTYRLDDWWPPSPDCGVGNCIGGMAPLTFWNINGGKRDRTGLFGEWEAKWSPQWLTLAGVRIETVKADTGPVTGYFTSTTPLVNNLAMMMRTMYEASSVGTRAAFNAMDRARTDRNLDFTLLARHTPDDQRTYEFGLAQKTRSPNLYERYSWSTNGMALEMNNFVGDGNGYLGNPDLKPEVAHTLSFTGDWHGAQDTELKVTPYYTHVSRYIDAVRIAGNISMYVNGVLTSVPNATLANGYVKLQYANQSARLYGIDVSGKMPLAKTELGDWSLKGLLNYTSGKNLDTGDNLYNIMPLNAKLTVAQKLGGWDNGIEIVGVEAKARVSAVRNEMKTPGYGLINLRASHSWKQVRIDFGVENLFNRLYYLPLGGAYTGQGATMSLDREVGTVATNGGNATTWGTAVPGAGRSLYAGVNFKFR